MTWCPDLLPLSQCYMLALRALQAAGMWRPPAAALPFLHARLDAVSEGAVQVLYQAECCLLISGVHRGRGCGLQID